MTKGSYFDAEAAVENFEYSTKSLTDKLIMLYPSLFCLKYKPIKSKPLTFISKKSATKNRPWQRQILDDDHPNKVVEKARQLGLSELSLSEVLWFLVAHKNTKVMYTFPRFHQVQDFSNTRVNPVFAQSPYLKSLLESSEVNNVSTKQIGDSYLFLRSAWGGAMGEGTDIDMMCIDEYDRMKAGVEHAFQEGLSASKFGWNRRWSTPTTPGFGINRLYQESDQMRYFHTCPHCGEKQFLTADENLIQLKSKGVNIATQEIEEGSFIIGCRKCKGELDRWQEGEWVAAKPSIKETRGYHISQLDATWISADGIMRRKFRYSSKQLFYNYILGEPYANEGLIVYEQDIRNNIRLSSEVIGRTSDYAAVVAGIDWGEPSWMIILGLRQNGEIDVLNLYYIENPPATPLNDASMFTAILKAYNPNYIVADAGYGSDKNSYLFTQFPNAFYSCHWTTSKDANARIRFLDNWDERKHDITVDKTVKIQRMLHSVKNGSIGFFPWSEKLQILASHINNVRVLDEEDEGVIYQKATRIGADHLACCLAYALIAVDRLSNYGVSFRNPGGFEFIDF